MEFQEKYTTKEKADADTTGKEKEKTVLSSDAFAIGETIGNLIKSIMNKSLK